MPPTFWEINTQIPSWMKLYYNCTEMNSSTMLSFMILYKLLMKSLRSSHIFSLPGFSWLFIISWQRVCYKQVHTKNKLVSIVHQMHNCLSSRIILAQLPISNLQGILHLTVLTKFSKMGINITPPAIPADAKLQSPECTVEWTSHTSVKEKLKPQHENFFLITPIIIEYS